MSRTFRYFERPYDYSTYHEDAKRCDICGEDRPVYDGPFYGERDDIERVCEECLAAGRLRDLDLETNEGDSAALRASLAALRPELNEVERERIGRERDDEVRHMTPHVVTWQDFIWPVHCGDYCRYVGEVGQRDLLALAPDGSDGPAFLMTHDYQRTITDIALARDIWDGIPREMVIANSPAVYLFRCLTCDEPLLIWDAD